MYQPSASGQRQQPQRLGGRRAVDDDHVPLAGERVQPQLQQRQHLLGARDDGELLGGDRVDPGHVEHREQVALDVGPGLLEAQLRVDLLDEEPSATSVGLRAHRARRRRRPASAPRRWRGPGCGGPVAAASAAVPAATVDLPTPPLPVNRRMRNGEGPLRRATRRAS